MVRRCEFCDSPVPADATVCPVCHEEIAEETLERILPLLKRPDAPEVRVMAPTERMWGIIRRPGPTYRDIGQRPDAVGPFIVIILNALVIAAFYIAITSKMTVQQLVNATLVTSSILDTSHGGIFYVSALMSMIPSIMLGFFYLVIGSAFAHLAFKITGGTGNRKKTVSIIGYSMFPVVIFRLIAIVVVLVSMETQFIGVYPSGATVGAFEAATQAIYESSIWLTVDFLMTASFFWVGFLLIFGIREAHDTSTIWAFIVSVLCMIVLVWTFWQVH
ncbi:MAG: YIP1 family protein [Candidatus Thorarchaeota archaeon]|nr:MAG: YIP1 family protein [Candidatus Thorarchaeota archaeon]